MPTDPLTEINELKRQVGTLQQQLEQQSNLIAAQIALNSAKQIQQAQLTKAVADELKNQATAQFNLQSEQAKAPFAELSGIKAAIGGWQLPAGQSGTVQIMAGPAGTALLRSKDAMLKILDDAACKLADQLTDCAVLVTDSQLEQADHADFIVERIGKQTSDIENATARAAPAPVPASAHPAVAPTSVLSGTMASAYSAGLVLDTINSLGKLFRVDRKVDVFLEEAESGQLLGYLMEAKKDNFTANPTAAMGSPVSREANSLLDKLNTLFMAAQNGNARLEELKKIEAEETASKPNPSRLPSSDKITELNAQLTSSKSLLESLDPSQKLDAFWAQVKGQLIRAAIKDCDRLLIEVRSQTLQVTETRWWRSNRLTTSSAIQIAYRIFDKDGNRRKSGVILQASEAKTIKFDEQYTVSFPST